MFNVYGNTKNGVEILIASGVDYDEAMATIERWPSFAFKSPA